MPATRNANDGPLPVIAVVGGIGSGKSVVARELAARGGYLIQADELGHEALRRPEMIAEIVARWGNDVVDEAGNVSRRKLGQVVFAAADELRYLESLVFPYIAKRIQEEKAVAAGPTGVRFVVLDAAVLLEAGWTEDVAHLLFVDAPREVRLERLSRTRGWDERELTRREASQMPLAEKKSRANAVIDNAGGLDGMRVQVSDLLKVWKLG